MQNEGPKIRPWPGLSPYQNKTMFTKIIFLVAEKWALTWICTALYVFQNCILSLKSAGITQAHIKSKPNSRNHNNKREKQSREQEFLQP